MNVYIHLAYQAHYGCHDSQPYLTQLLSLLSMTGSGEVGVFINRTYEGDIKFVDATNL